jgi:hypothetical protein
MVNLAAVNPEHRKNERIARMPIMHFRRIERRRTVRATVSMNVLAYGESKAGEKFKFWTRTTSVSQHGGVMVIESPIAKGQELQLMNEYNLKKALARVVSLRIGKEGEVIAAFEFVQGGERFWSMTFPASGARGFRKPMPKGAAETN